jgi:dihydroneopterin aldolase
MPELLATILAKMGVALIEALALRIAQALFSAAFTRPVATRPAAA